MLNRIVREVKLVSIIWLSQIIQLQGQTQETLTKTQYTLASQPEGWKKNDKRGKLDKLNDIISEDLITGCNRRNLNVVVQYDIPHKKLGSITINQLPYYSKDLKYKLEMMLLTVMCYRSDIKD